MSYRYFSAKDFNTPPCNPLCSIDDMQDWFLHRLDVARFHAGVPFVITSAYRAVEHEKAMGRDGSSSHTKGLAVDIRARTPAIKFKVVTGLLKAGFSRIFLYESFIHVDADNEKPQNLLNFYG